MFGMFLEKLYHFKVPKNVKIGEECPKFAFKLKTGLARGILFVSTASRICELKSRAETIIPNYC